MKYDFKYDKLFLMKRWNYNSVGYKYDFKYDKLFLMKRWNYNSVGYSR